MTDREILSNAIDKAMVNDWDGKVNSGVHIMYCSSCEHYTDHTVKEAHAEHDYLEEDMFCSIIFSHSFAKAFWGEELKLIKNYLQKINFRIMLWYPDRHNHPYYVKTPAWQYHLQQMILEENPIAYLERFL